MAKVTVFQCKTWDDPQGKWIVEPGYWTRERIAQMPKAEIILGTELEIDETELDEDQHYKGDL